MMSGTVITTYSTIGLTLSSASQNPVTITQSGEINASSSSAIDGVSFASAWNIDNAGTLKGIPPDATTARPRGMGISLSGSGTVTNEKSSYIYGNGFGIDIAQSGSVTNFGTIRGENYIGINIEYASHVINGSSADTSAYIGGGNGGVWGSDSGYLENFGTILATFGPAVELGDGLDDTVINGSATDRTAIMDGRIGGADLGTGTLTNFGTIIGGPPLGSNYGAALNYKGLILNDGLIEGGSGVLIGATGTLINAGTIIGYSGFDTAVYFVGSSQSTPSKLIVDPGAEFNGTVTGHASVSMELAAGGGIGTISGLGTEFTDIKTIAIDTRASWIISGDAAGLANGQTITGFSTSDMLVLESFSATSSIVSGNDLILSDGSTTETLNISTDVTSPAFVINDVAGGTEIFICYLRGTHILTAAGERLVEDLRIGDEVPTHFGGMRRIKWIGRQSFAGRFVRNNPAQIPVCISAGAFGRGLPRRELFVSPGHSMLLGGKLVLAKSLVNGVTITQGPAPAEIHYYQIEFDTHDCLKAEGVWSESFADGPGLRNQFHNAAEFFALYPNYLRPDALQLCVPRPECGPALAAALRPIVRHAAARVPRGPLRGYIDLAANGRIEGWAQDKKNPELPVLLEVLVGNRVIGTVLACDYRADLEAAGIGQGRCHFVFQAPGKYRGANLRIRRAADGAEVAMSDGCANGAVSKWAAR